MLNTVGRRSAFEKYFPVIESIHKTFSKLIRSVRRHSDRKPNKTLRVQFSDREVSYARWLASGVSFCFLRVASDVVRC